MAGQDVAAEAPLSDGRLARGQRTRVKVAEALISLLEDGDAQPTAKEVAERAHISVRLVFHHFEDMDALYRAVIQLQASRHWSGIREIPADLPLADRIDRTVRQRARLFEAIGSVRRAVTPQALRSHDLSTMLATSNRFLRDLAANTFAPELSAAGSGGGQLLEALDAVTSWDSWERLRTGQSLSTAAARRVMTQLLHALFPAGASPVGS